MNDASAERGLTERLNSDSPRQIMRWFTDVIREMMCEEPDDRRQEIGRRAMSAMTPAICAVRDASNLRITPQTGIRFLSIEAAWRFAHTDRRVSRRIARRLAAFLNDVPEYTASRHIYEATDGRIVGIGENARDRFRYAVAPATVLLSDERDRTMGQAVRVFAHSVLSQAPVDGEPTAWPYGAEWDDVPLVGVFRAVLDALLCAPSLPADAIDRPVVGLDRIAQHLDVEGIATLSGGARGKTLDTLQGYLKGLPQAEGTQQAPAANPFAKEHHRCSWKPIRKAIDAVLSDVPPGGDFGSAAPLADW